MFSKVELRMQAYDLFANAIQLSDENVNYFSQFLMLPKFFRLCDGRVRTYRRIYSSVRGEGTRKGTTRCNEGAREAMKSNSNASNELQNHCFVMYCT